MEDLLSARLDDAVERAYRENRPCFLGFLTTEQSSVAYSQLKNKGIYFEFFGGFEEAERTYVCVCPYKVEYSAYPIIAVTLLYRKSDNLSHRDFLGALMALGISRESVGDILVEEGRAVIFLSRNTAPFVKSQLEKVGSCGVKIKDGFELPLPQLSQKVLCTDTVASLRLDAVISALCNFSRSTANEVLLDGRVSINSVCCMKPEKRVSDGDKVTVKGKGRFEIVDTSLLSKKGRTILKYNKYI